MKVARWGNSLAIRIPASLASELALQEGDDVSLTRRQTNAFEIERQREVSEAIACIRAMQIKLPDDYRFDRESLYERGGE